MVNGAAPAQAAAYYHRVDALLYSVRAARRKLLRRGRIRYDKRIMAIITYRHRGGAKVRCFCLRGVWT